MSFVEAHFGVFPAVVRAHMRGVPVVCWPCLSLFSREHLKHIRQDVQRAGLSPAAGRGAA